MVPQSLRAAYYGIPRFGGEVFRATKAPTIIFLFGMIGVPIIMSATMALAMVMLHSEVPFAIVAGGLVQMGPSHFQNTPLMRLVETLTPAQLALGRYIFYLLIGDAFICAGVTYWWSYRLYTFLSRRRKQNL